MITKSKMKWMLTGLLGVFTFSGAAQSSFCKEYLALVPGDRKSAIYDLEKSLDNQLFVAGHTLELPTGMSDFAMARINPINGALGTIFQFDSGFDDRSFSCVPTSDGGIISVGYAYQGMTEQARLDAGLPPNTLNSTFSMIKINGDGTIGWQHHLDIGAYDDMAFSIIGRSDGTFLVLGRGHLDDDSLKGKLLILVNVTLDGTILSINSYDEEMVSGEELFGVDLLEDQNGDVFILAAKGYGSSGTNDLYEDKGLAEKILLIKLDADLDFIFAREVDFTRFERRFGVGVMPYDLAQADNGDLAIVGHVVVDGALAGRQSTGFIMEFNTAGTFLGRNLFQISGRDNTIAMTVEPVANGYIISGTTLADSYIHAVDNNLNNAATSLFSADASTETYSILQEQEFFFFGGTHVLGNTSSMALEKKQAFALNCCESEWDARRLANIDVRIALPTYNRKSPGSNENPDLALVSTPHFEFTNCASMAPLSITEENDSDDLFTVYPNPANQQVNVRLSDLQEGDLIQLYGTDGKLYGNQTPIDGTVTFDVQDLSPGVYVITYVHSGQTYQERIIIE